MWESRWRRSHSKGGVLAQHKKDGEGSGRESRRSRFDILRFFYSARGILFQLGKFISAGGLYYVKCFFSVLVVAFMVGDRVDYFRRLAGD